MSDIVLKDKNGVKNTYSNVNVINIPDGKGGFVKYSLGSTLPEYDGTVIIEKAGVRGLRRYKEDAAPITSLDASSQNQVDEFFTNYSFDIEPVSDGYDYTFEKLSCAFFDINTNAVSMVFLANNGEDYEVQPLTNFIVDMPYPFNIISTANATVDEWLLANTEGVSV